MTSKSGSPDRKGVEQSDAHFQARSISEALPFMQQYAGQTIVIKYGGHAMGDESLSKSFARDIVMMKQSGVNPVVVHGGGPQIGAMLERLNITSEFKAGMRVTDQQTVEVVEMVLAGSINKKIVGLLNQEGGQAVGISGKDANLMVVKKMERTIKDPDSNIEQAIDLGFVGEPDQVNKHIIDVMLGSDLIPVVAPIGVSAEGSTYNVNADTFAASLAVALKAKRLLLLTDVEGVLDKDGVLQQELTNAQAKAFIADGTISGGMIPKIQSCMDVIEGGVEGVVIINGKVPHAVLLEIFTEHGSGTLLKG